MAHPTINPVMQRPRMVGVERETVHLIYPSRQQANDAKDAVFEAIERSRTGATEPTKSVEVPASEVRAICDTIVEIKAAHDQYLENIHNPTTIVSTLNLLNVFERKVKDALEKKR